MSTFATRLRELRTKEGIPQHALASRLSFSQSAISGWENGTREPTLSAISQLTAYFSVSADYLLGLSDEKEAPSDAPIIPENCIEVSPFEREVLLKYRILPPSEQVYICRMLQLNHPAARRAEIKQA